MERKYWEILLSNWRGNGGNGFTIPFIIGSQNHLPPSHTIQSVDDLLMDIATNNDIEIYITFCFNLNDIILCLLDKSKEKVSCKNLTNKGNQSKLFISIFLEEELGNDLNSVIEELTNKYQPFVNAREYSLNEDGERRNYKTEEIEFIKNSFKTYL